MLQRSIGTFVALAILFAFAACQTNEEPLPASADADATSATPDTTNISSDTGGSAPDSNNTSQPDIASAQDTSSTTPDTTTTTPDTQTSPYTWGEATQGPTDGPFGDVKAFRSGCGQQIWVRFIPTEDFHLLEDVTHFGGTAYTTTYFSVPGFTQGQPTFYLLQDQGNRPFGEGSYTFDFTVEHTSGNRLTYSFTVDADERYERGGFFADVDVRSDSSGETQLTVTPQFSGDLQRLFIYDDDPSSSSYGCLLNTVQFFEPVRFTQDLRTEFSTLTRLDTFQPVRAVLQGVDSSVQYIYYTTLAFEGP